MPEARILVVGVDGGRLPPGLAERVGAAAVVAGGARHLDAHAPPQAGRIPIGGDLGPALDALADALAGSGGADAGGVDAGPVCVLASGDPGFFGIVRALAGRFGPEVLEVHPAPSSVAQAFARLGLPWDDAVVASAHGRPLADAARAVACSTKAAVLTSPDSPPEALGKELIGLGSTFDRAVVCSRLGEESEAIVDVDLEGLAAGTFPARSVVVLLSGSAIAPRPTLEWGRPSDAFAHRAGMVTKAEVRAVALGKLALPPSGVLWDVGAGSGSVAVEAAAVAPGLVVVAVERDGASAARVRANAATHGVVVDVVAGEAPGALDGLPDPDRVFLGGGGIGVLDTVLDRLRPGGRVVATFAALDRAVAAQERLGHLVQVSVSRGESLPGGGVRLAAENPVFVVWGPGE